jgi:hypothetical protein
VLCHLVWWCVVCYVLLFGLCEVVQQGEAALRDWNISWESSSHSGVNVLKLVVIFILSNNY